jgi:DNA-directed RNA polymerase specialized sigma24 family protein
VSDARRRTPVARRCAAARARDPVDFQIVLELHYWEDMSVAEIASVVAIATGTA